MVLSNIRVLDISDEKGALCSKLLADLGAEVIRVEQPHSRAINNYSNSGKSHIALNITSLKGQNIFKRLICKSDIFVESLQPEYLKSENLDYLTLGQINPSLIMCSITPFGQKGPYSDFKSSNFISSSLGGSLYINGMPSKAPLKPSGDQAYNVTALYAANAIMLSLIRRQTAGCGCYLDISIQECVAAALDHVLVRQASSGEVANRTGHIYWNNAFRVFRCKDGFILFSLTQQWETLVEWMNSEGIGAELTSPEYSDESYRERRLDHIVEVIGEWSFRHTVAEILETGQAMRFSCAPVNSLEEVINNDHLLNRRFFREVLDKASGYGWQYPGPPVNMSSSHREINTASLHVIKNDKDIYVKLLGMSDDELDTLKKEGVI